MDEACPKCGADDGIAGKCAAMFVAKNAEITSLRAELSAERTAFAAQQQVSQTFAEELGKIAYASRAAARQDAEKLAAIHEMILRTRTRLEAYCNEANAGRVPSDAREFMRRVQCGFDSMMSEAKDAELAHEHARRQDAAAIAEWKQSASVEAGLRREFQQTAREHAEEKARMREALTTAELYLCGSRTGVPLVNVISIIRAALACRPQGEKS